MIDPQQLAHDLTTLKAAVRTAFDGLVTRGAGDPSSLQLASSAFARFDKLIDELERLEGPPDLVLIDDDPLVEELWRLGASDRGLKLKVARQVEDVETLALPRSTPIFVDLNLGLLGRGLGVADGLRRKGYDRLYLTTGQNLAKWSSTAGFRGVVGKDFPSSILELERE